MGVSAVIINDEVLLYNKIIKINKQGREIFFVILDITNPFKMFQELGVGVLIIIALTYVVYRLYGSIKKKQACDKCELMQAVKKEKKA